MGGGGWRMSWKNNASVRERGRGQPNISHKMFHLDLFKPLHRLNEESPALPPVSGHGYGFTDQRNGRIDLFILNAEQQSGHAAAQEPSGRGDPGNAVLRAR